MKNKTDLQILSIVLISLGLMMIVVPTWFAPLCIGFAIPIAFKFAELVNEEITIRIAI